MAALGYACLIAGFATSIYAVAASLHGARTRQRRWAESGRHAIYALAALLVGAMVVLEAAFLRSDLSFALVAQNSSTSTPAFYKVTAMWSSQEGSLLLWVFLLSVYASIVLRITRHRLREITPYATAVMGAVAAFFLGILVIAENPFQTIAAPAEGAGLNPLLRHPAMMIHPPMLYAGYVGFSVPFAFAIGALVTRRTGADWIGATRRFALAAWTFLGFGIMLGALWSYTELGWGGYWAWDAVENASLMPWLIGTAFIHSIMVQERRGILRIWNVSLVLATFVLSLLGTFLVRSGILDSIHAFGASTLGPPFLAFIAVITLGSAALVASRARDLRSEGRIESALSREAFFLLNNLVLVGLCFVVFWGTFFPLISEAVTGTEASVGPPWFNRYTVPVALVLVLLIAIGPVLAWRRTTRRNLRRAVALPLAASLVTVALLVALTPAEESVRSLIMFWLGALVLSVVARELWRGTVARRTMSGEALPLAFVSLIARNRRRYGGYMVHAGIAILFLGVAASSAFVKQQDARLSPGDSVEVGGYTVRYAEPTLGVEDDRAGTGAPLTIGATLTATRAGERETLRPARNYYGARGGGTESSPIRDFFEGEATSEVDVRWGLIRDLWIAVQPDLTGLEEPIRRADEFSATLGPGEQGVLVVALADRFRRLGAPMNVRVLVSPLVAWIWIGGGIAVLGALVALWPARERRLAGAYAARVGRDIARVRA